ncbi:MAG: FMN-binding glutamate synthase family protein [Planctomycetota bacterium]
MHPTRWFWILSSVLLFLVVAVGLTWSPAFWALLPLAGLVALGVSDITTTAHSVKRNFPVVGNLRYLFELIRPEIQQYFVESEISGRPYSRELRSVVYQRAKGVIDTRPFGTVRDLEEEGTEWIEHSIAPVASPAEAPRVLIGEGQCARPYESSLLIASGMSFGSISKNAVLALSGGAKDAGFAVNTGEGGLSPHHLEPGCDLIWQLGTGYFGARSAGGTFDIERYRERAILPEVKMIEVKLSQGAKPGHGGILPGRKVTREIALIRGVPEGEDVNSPPYHTAFQDPKSLLEFLSLLREESGGKPVGIKLCVGRPREFFGILKACLATGLLPDFIAVDGAEGGTGAAPLEFSNSIGLPLTEGLLFVHNGLIGAGLRDRVKVVAAGKIVTGFQIVQRMAIGADVVAMARPMMFALGCIQALACNMNTCPVGVATQNPHLMRGLHVGDKRRRVANFHRATVHSTLEILAAAGLTHPDELRPEHIWRRSDDRHIENYEEIYDYLQPHDLVGGSIRTRSDDYGRRVAAAWDEASADRF